MKTEKEKTYWGIGIALIVGIILGFSLGYSQPIKEYVETDLDSILINVEQSNVEGSAISFDIIGEPYFIDGSLERRFEQTDEMMSWSYLYSDGSNIFHRENNLKLEFIPRNNSLIFNFTIAGSEYPIGVED